MNIFELELEVFGDSVKISSLSPKVKSITAQCFEGCLQLGCFRITPSLGIVTIKLNNLVEFEAKAFGAKTVGALVIE